jgi:hypothetical protein
MAAPVWSVGQVLTASDVNTWFVPLAAYRTSNSAQVKNTTLTPDPVLFVPVAANAIYEFRCYLNAASASTTSGMSMTFTVPAGSGGSYSGWLFNSGGGQFQAPTSIGVQRNGLVGATANANYSSSWFGGLRTGGTAGNFQVNWCETTLDATNGAYMLTDSALILNRVG